MNIKKSDALIDNTGSKLVLQPLQFLKGFLSAPSTVTWEKKKEVESPTE